MMYLMTEDRNVYTVGDIYNQNKTDDKMMLSPYPADFWKPYRDNHNYFDRRFKVLYKSFFPYDQEEAEGRESVADDFRFDVYAHLMTNDKRYSELFRVNVIPDNDAYSLTNNVDYTETYSEENGRDTEFNKGSETDTEDLSRTKGAQTDTEDLEFTKGSETDTEDLEFTKGSETDTEDLSTTYGAQDVDTTQSTSAYNESTFTATDKTEVDNGSHEDTQDNSRTFGQRVDSEDNSRTFGQRIDSEDNSRTYGQRIDSEDNSRTYGARKDITEETGSKDYTLHKVGNMGVQTVDDMLEKHVGVWSMFDFYGLIFREIARDLLRGC